MKRFTKIFSAILVIAMIFTMPGAAIGISAIGRAMTQDGNSYIQESVSDGKIKDIDLSESTAESAISEILDESVYNEMSKIGRFKADLASGKITVLTPKNCADYTQKLATITNESLSVSATLTETDSTAGNADMTKYIKSYVEPFKISSLNENINLTNGSLDLSYSLAYMAGIGGMDLSLSLSYSSDDSNTEEAFWDVNDVILSYYVIIGDKLTYYDTNTSSWVVLTWEGEVLTFDNYDDSIDCAYRHDLQQPTIIEYEGHEAYYYTSCTIDYGPEYSPTVSVVQRTANPQRNNLAPGWKFNIPSIEIQKFNDFDTGNTVDTYRIITLENGTTYNLVNYSFVNRNYTDMTITAVTYTIGSRTATHKLTYKDGTIYYFDSDGLCLRKEDRFGNGINYSYTGTGTGSVLSGMSDDFGRTITLTYSGTNNSILTVVSSDGASTVISLSGGDTFKNRHLDSINCGFSEIYSFEYTDTLTMAWCIEENDPDYVNYAVITEVTYPTDDTTEYAYDVIFAPWGYGDAERPVLSSKRDIVFGVIKNSTSYVRTGDSYEASFMRDLNAGTESDYTYDVSVQTPSGTTTYRFNDESRLIASSNSSFVETTSYNSLGLPSSKTQTDFGSGGNLSVVTTDTYTYDTKGNVLTHTNTYGTVTTYTYDATYSTCLSETYRKKSTETILIEYTLSTDKKTTLQTTVKSNGTLCAKTTYTYDARGNVLTKTDYVYPGTATTVTTYSYADNVTRPAGISMSGLYCTSMSVSGIVNADGVTQSDYTETYIYDIAGRKTSVTNARGYTTVSVYNTQGRLVSVTYPNGSAEYYSYNIPNGTVTYTDRTGYVIVSTYDVLGNLLSVRENSTGTYLETRTYDAGGRLTSVTSGSLSVMQYTYDTRSRVISAAITDMQGTVVSSETYGYTVATVGNANLLKTTKTVVGDTNAPSVITSEYTDKGGRTVRTGRMLGSVELVNTFTYDLSGNKITEAIAGGGTTTYTYDFAGNVLTVTNALGNISSSTYTSTGLLLTQTDPLGNTAIYTYDKLGRKLTETVPADDESSVTYYRTTKYYYDACGNVTETKVTMQAVGSSGAVYSRTVNTYDNMNRLTQSVSYDGASAALTCAYTYNNADKILTETVGGATVTNAYNSRGELVSVTDAQSQTETYVYDNISRLTSKTDRNGTLFSYTYNAAGAVLTETASRTGFTTQTNTYTYTKTGLVRTESNGTVTITRTYDSLGRLITETEADGTDTSVSEYSYDSRDLRVEYKLTTNGELMLWEGYSYDTLGRMTGTYNKYYYSYTVTPQTYTNEIVQYEYSERHSYTITDVSACGDTDEDIYIYYSSSQTWKKLSIAVGDGIYSGSLTKDTSGIAGTVTCTYPFDGQEIYTVSQLSSTFVYDSNDWNYYYYMFDENEEIIYTLFFAYYPTYDAIGIYTGEYMFSSRSIIEPYTVSGIGQTAYAQYSYDANNNLTSTVYNNGTSTVYTYNKANLPKTMENKRGSSVLSSFAYTYYLNGNIKDTTENTGKTTTYIYDGLGRLTSETCVDNNCTSVIQYTYDSRGNRATMTKNGTTTTYTYDNNNRMTVESKSGIVTVYSYDNNGNQLQALKNGNYAGTYTYDLFGRQISYTLNFIAYTYYTYRPDGLRHSIGSTKHVWDGTNIVLDKTGTAITLYYRALTLIYAETGTEKTYYIYNGHGDVIALASSTGVITKTYVYDAFGEEKDPDDMDTNRFRYCGEYYDIESGTIYLRARYYDASTGRFTSEDPIKDGTNWYSYCAGNPVNLVDPSGLWNWGKILTIAAIVVTTVIVVAAVAATGGAAAAAFGAAVGTYLGASSVGAATIVGAIGVSTVIAADVAIAASNITEVVTDGYNPIRDEMCGGNQETYDAIQIVASVASFGIVEVGSSYGAYEKSVEDDVNKEKTTGEKIKEIKNNPTDWAKTDESKEPCVKYQSGLSIEAEYTNNYTNEKLYEHTLYNANGIIKEQHYRGYAKQIKYYLQ